MTHADEQAYAARQVLAGAFGGVLSTHSLAVPGYPFGSVVPYALDQEGLPLLLLSHLSQHTKNIQADSRCGLTVTEAGDGDLQQLGRLSAVGEVTPVSANADVERYFGYFPHARMYFEQLGFRFYRLAPRRFHWNGGFATARWFDSTRIVRANPLSTESQRRIVTHMNQDHADALRVYLQAMGDTEPAHDVAMVGIDAEGIDVRVSGRLRRIPLSRPIGSPAEARAVLVQMASPGH